MAAIDFPASPTVGQVFVAGNGVTYQWTGTLWIPIGATQALYVGDTPPASPGPNQLWWNSTLGSMYLWYNDGNTTQWVPTSPAPAAGATVLQTLFFPFTNFVNSAANFPVTNSIPTNAQGVQYMTASITAKSASSKIDIDVLGIFSVSSGAYNGIGLFQDATVNALAAVPFSGNANDAIEVPLRFSVPSPGANVATTFNVRGGSNAGAVALYFNGIGNAAAFGGVCMSSIKLTERI